MAAMDEEDEVFKGFNLRELEKELSTAVEEEEKRVAVDEMKKRAIKSAASYDEFKNLVACAGQKPIERGGLSEITKSRRKGFGGLAGGSVRSSAQSVGGRGPALAPSGAASVATSTIGTGDLVAPKKQHEFRRQWRKLAGIPGGRYHYLRVIPGKRMARLFASDLEPTVLSEIVTAYSTAIATELPTPAPASATGSAETEGFAAAGAGDSSAASLDALEDRIAGARHMCSQLSALAGVERFALARDLMTASDKDALRSVLDLAAGLKGPDDSTMSSLAAALDDVRTQYFLS